MDWVMDSEVVETSSRPARELLEPILGLTIPVNPGYLWKNREGVKELGSKIPNSKFNNRRVRCRLGLHPLLNLESVIPIRLFHSLGAELVRHLFSLSASRLIVRPANSFAHPSLGRCSRVQF